MTAKPIKSTNDNPTPTTLRESLEEVEREAIQSGEPHFWLVDQATQSILEQLKALLPKKPDIQDMENVNSTLKHEFYNVDFTRGFNQAIDRIEKAIEEWAK